MSLDEQRIPVTEPPRSEAALVNDWRFERFFRIGFTPTQAQRLADSRACYHQAEELAAAGCQLELVLRIISD